MYGLHIDQPLMEGRRHLDVRRAALFVGVAASTGGEQLVAHELRIHSKRPHLEVNVALSSEECQINQAVTDHPKKTSCD
jgi:hypothetical protein